MSHAAPGAAAPETVRALLHAAVQRLASQSLAAPQARLEAEILLAHALGVSRTWFYAHADDAIDALPRDRFEALLAARIAGRPIAYVTGSREFWSLALAVTPDTLIPRADTELLVEQALAHLPDRPQAGVLDLGTGSGAVALALAHERPQARITASDLSTAALAVARANAARLGIANVTFVAGSWFEALVPQRFDLIVSNPPYIAEDDFHLQQGDLRFEPRTALASGPDGLDAIRHIAAHAQAYLAPGAWLLLEHGQEQAAAVRAVLVSHGFGDVTTWRDLEQRDRISGGVAPNA